MEAFEVITLLLSSWESVENKRGYVHNALDKANISLAIRV